VAEKGNRLLQRVAKYLDGIRRTAFGQTVAGRGLTVFPNDIFLVSYLRSGSTWARFLVGNFCYENKEISFTNVNRLIPVIDGHPDHRLRTLPRILKSHECFDPRYPRVIYFVRDPRDVAVSFYFYNIKTRVIADGYALDQFVDRFLNAKTVAYADRLGSWEDHVLSWIRLRQGRSTFRLVRYEDLLRDPTQALLNIASLLEIEPIPERIQRAIRLSSAEHMRSLEKKQWTRWGTTKGTRSDIPFVREAKSGGWHKHLSESAVHKIEAAWGGTMQELGYKLVTSPRRLAKAAPPIES
jgi:sulfotransferase family protein